MTTTRPTLAVWKFASCDGCQLTVLNLEEDLLPLAGEIDIAHFLEASRANSVGSVRSLVGRRVHHHTRRCRTHP